MRLTSDEKTIIINFMANRLMDAGFTVKQNKFNSISRVSRYSISCVPSISDSVREGKNGYSFIELTAGSYSHKDLGFYDDARGLLSKYNNHNEERLDMSNYKRLVAKFVDDLKMTYINIKSKHENLEEELPMDNEIEFTELELDDTLTRREKEKVAHYFWDIGTQEAAAYLRSRGIDTTLFDEIHASKLSEEGFDADYPFEDMSDEDYYRAADAESEAFIEFLTRSGLNEVRKLIDNYFDDFLDDDELIESTSLKEEDEESTDVIEVDEIEFSDKPTSDLLDFVMDAIYDEFDGNVTVEYNEEFSDEPDYLEFEITDESEEYGGNTLIVVTDSRADELLRQEVESYVDDCLPDLIDCGNIALEDYLDEDWFDDYRRDWYEEWVLYGMDTEELVDELVTNEHLDWDELADLIVYEDDEVDIAATAEALDNNYRALDSVKNRYVDELCSQHESAVEWYLDHVGSHDLKYLLKDNDDAFDKEAYIDDLVGDASYDRGNWIGRYNGYEYYFGTHDGNTYYAYIQ